MWLFFTTKNGKQFHCYVVISTADLCSSHASGVDCCFCHVDLLDGSHGLLLVALLAGMMLIPINLVTWIAILGPNVQRYFFGPQKTDLKHQTSGGITGRLGLGF